MSSDLKKLAGQMKSDWDRRIAHDYRFWMSDGYSDDASMWAAGKRDYDILVSGLSPGSSSTVLELGCGVGRILKSALVDCGRVIGIDVSEKAIDKARSLIGMNPRAELYVGNGVDLQPVASGCVDLVISFATLCSIPLDVCASYLKDIRRVLKPGGIARLQMYTGKPQLVEQGDTLNIRAYPEENLRNALTVAGFEVQFVKELELPLQVSFEEMGFKAVVVSVRNSALSCPDSKTIAAALLPEGEAEKIDDAPGKDLEYWMSLNYAKTQAEKGEGDQARKTLEFASQFAQNATIDVSDVLGRIQNAIEKASPQKSPEGTCPVTGESVFERNLSLLKKRFPAAAAIVEQAGWDAVEVRQSQQGPVLYEQGQCLDHPEKPQAAADTWAKRLLQEQRMKNASNLVVLGAGAGYHLDSLAREISGGRTFSVIEPSGAALKAALSVRDQVFWLERVDQLLTGKEAVLPQLKGGDELVVRPQAQVLEPGFCEKLKSAFYGRRGLSLLNPTIGVMGPLSGGTLPMLEYVSRALVMLGQRVRVFDMSSFDQGYLALEKFVFDKQRRKAIESHYCETCSQAVLESVNEKPIDILFCMALAPVSPRVLTELRSRGVITVLWFVEDFARFTYWKENAKFYDFIFCIQKGRCIEALKAAGAGEVHYMPVACDPPLHAPQQISAEEKARWGSPVSFMGAGYHNRQQIFASLADMPLKIWGTEWPTCRPFDRLVQENGRRLKPDEYVKIFSSSDININLHSSHERDGVDPFGDFLNPRTFELASAGAFQLVDRRTLLSECFTEGKEVAAFSSGAELKDKIAYYLAHPDERERLAKASRERALSEHTYQHRLRDMLSIIYSSKYEFLKNRLDNAPWQRMLRRAKRHDELYQRCEKAFRRGEEPNLDGLVSDIVTGAGKLTETEQKLLFLFHVTKQIIRMTREEAGREQ